MLAIAGHDPGGGAGLTTDLAAWQALGIKGASVCTALTVQDARGVSAVRVTEPELLRAALAAVDADAPPAGIKLGMLGDAAVATVVADYLQRHDDIPVVWDTVLAGGAGGRPLLRLDGAEAALARLAAACSVITPNRDEAAALLGLERWNSGGPPPPAWIDAVRARWLRAGRTVGVVLKGGHADGERAVDWLITGDAPQPCSVARLPLPPGGRTHGTGCHYAATLAALLADGAGLLDAVVEAQWRTAAGIAHAWDGHARPHVRAGAPLRSDTFPVAAEAPAPPFAALSRPPGFYPVVPDVDWALRLLDWGVDTLQLRIKDLQGAALRAAVDRVAAAARERGAQLFINDHWREALDAGAFGVHLGQEDLPDADLDALRAAGLRLGVSTHTPVELARAHAVGPSYIALGPVFPTSLKQMPYAPLGLARLRDWAARCKPRYPVVAIGGISLERAAAVFDAGADGVAVVGAVVAAPQPREAVRAGLALAADAALWRARVAAPL